MADTTAVIDPSCQSCYTAATTTAARAIEERALRKSFVWFDIGYTLLYMQREATYREALLQFGVDADLEEIRLQFHLTDKLFMREYPGIFLQPVATYMPAYLGLMNFRLGISLDVCELNACWEDIKAKVGSYWQPYPEAAEVLAELKKRGIGMGVISNWDATARDVLRAAGLIDYFGHLFISSEVNCNKPDARIFRMALETAGVDARQCLYVGDNYYDDCLGSRRVGMAAVIVNRYGFLGIEEIEDCPVINDLTGIFHYI